jgi:hypothetical protein
MPSGLIPADQGPGSLYIFQGVAAGSKSPHSKEGDAVGYEGLLGASNCSRKISTEIQPTVFNVLFDQGIEVRFIHRDFVGQYPFDLGIILVHASNIIAKCATNHGYIACADYCDVHR